MAILDTPGGLFSGSKGGGGGEILGTVGNIIGSATKMLPSMIQYGVSAHKARQAEKMTPGVYNPLQTDLLQEIKAKKKALETGTAYAPQMSAISQSGAQAIRAAQNLGSDSGMMLSALSGINRSTGRNMNEMFGQMSQEGVQLSNLMNNLTQQMANRQYQISMADKLQRLAASKQAMKESQQNLMTGLSLGLDKMNIGDITKGTNLANLSQFPSTPSTMMSHNTLLTRAQFSPYQVDLNTSNLE